MPEASGRIVLGFDFGQKRIGIATGDTVTRTATPCTFIRCTASGPDWPGIERLLRQYQPDLLIVGAPRHADGRDSPRSAAAEQFASELERRFGVRVERCDEYRSSIEAAGRLRAARAAGAHPRRLRRGDVDGAAAAIILQRWLDAEGRIG